MKIRAVEIFRKKFFFEKLEKNIFADKTCGQIFTFADRYLHLRTILAFDLIHHKYF